jgi:pyruvate,water dikinase
MPKKSEEGEIAFVKWFSELSNKDIKIAGGKGASLSEMYNNKFPIPAGFMITAQAYSYFIEKTGLKEKIEGVLTGINKEDTKFLQAASEKIRKMIESAMIPKEMSDAIIEAYGILDVNKDVLGSAKSKALDILKTSHEPPFVAVRSSATTEDLADASFAGQQDSFLNVKGNMELVNKIKKCMSSLFTARAIYYRINKGFGATGAQIAVVIQKMIDSDKSGVMFSKSPVSDENVVLIESVWGLGEGIVSGMIKPDHYVVSRDDEMKIIKCEVYEKKIAIVRTASGDTASVKLTSDRANQQVLSTHEIKRLAQYALKLEEHYGKPQDIEFAISNGEIYIVQSRPITTIFKKANASELGGDIILAGLGASPGVASGTVKVVHNLNDLTKVQKGDILVTEMTNPDMVVDMQKAAGIITDEGGVTSHAAIVSREMGIPAVVGTGKATQNLHDGEIVTVDGNNGRVYAGKGETKLAEIKQIVPTKIKVKVIVDLPDYAERAAKTGAEAVGLTRLEGIIAECGKHPHYFVLHKDMAAYTKILFNGLTKIAVPFKEIWIRSSDIRSDEYRHLEGASATVEGNPMLGDHGIRFSIKHIEILQAELEAVKQLAQAHRDKIFGFMIPQVIGVEEFLTTKKAADKLGMPSNVKIGVMIETPAAVQIINELCEAGIKFISFGTNDLTQYMLAIDRNNSEVQDLYNEMNPAVLSAISYVIRRCKKSGVETSICGQAGSKIEMVKFLAKEGIDSVSVNADAAYDVSVTIQSVESEKNSYINNEQTKITAKEENKSEESTQNSKSNATVLRDSTAYDDKDIEDVVLKELDDEYNPGGSETEDGLPKLNDAFVVNNGSNELEDIVGISRKEKDKE